MGSRLGGMKGGGFLNNVDATFVDYEFTNAFPGGEPGDKPEIFAVLTIRPDGADEPVQTTLRGGSGQYLDIQDGHTLVNPEGQAARIWDKADLYRFLESVEEAGVADGGLDDTEPSVLSFTSLIGRRMRFVQEKDEARMAARAKAGLNPKREDKNTGKEYDFTRLIVTEVYDDAPPLAPVKQHVAQSAAEARRRTAQAAATKPTATKAKAGARGGAPTPFARGGKPNGAAAAATGAGDLDIEATAKLKSILDANGGEVLRSDLTRLVTTLLLTEKNPRREVLRKRIYSPEFLGSAEGIAFDEVAQTVSLS